jgi:hypothetical protein
MKTNCIESIEQASERAIRRAIEEMKAELNTIHIAQNEKKSKLNKQPTQIKHPINVTQQ